MNRLRSLFGYSDDYVSLQGYRDGRAGRAYRPPCLWGAGHYPVSPTAAHGAYRRGYARGLRDNPVSGKVLPIE